MSEYTRAAPHQGARLSLPNHIIQAGKQPVDSWIRIDLAQGSTCEQYVRLVARSAW